MKLFPRMSWDELMEVVQENAEVKQRLTGAIALWQRIMASLPEGLKVFEPASQVGSQFVTGYLAFC